jgi:hypothetical protein
MDRSDVCPGRLVRCKLGVPGFRKGALFQVLPALEGIPVSSFVGCRAVGSAPYKVWYFRPRDLIPAGWDEQLKRAGYPGITVGCQ